MTEIKQPVAFDARALRIALLEEFPTLAEWGARIEESIRRHAAAPVPEVGADFTEALGSLVMAACDYGHHAGRGVDHGAITSCRSVFDDERAKLIEAHTAALAADRAGVGQEVEQRDMAIAMLASWVACVQRNGTGWDDWDEAYKDAAYRPTPLRELLDAAIAKELKSWESPTPEASRAK